MTAPFDSDEFLRALLNADVDSLRAAAKRDAEMFDALAPLLKSALYDVIEDRVRRGILVKLGEAKIDICDEFVSIVVRGVCLIPGAPGHAP